MQSHGQLPINSTATFQTSLASGLQTYRGTQVAVSQRGNVDGVPVGGPIESGSMTFHTSVGEVKATYGWQGNRIWPSSEFLSQDSSTKVHAAATAGLENIVGRNLLAKPPLSHRVNGTTPLMVSAARGNASVVHRLIAAGAEPNEATSRMHMPPAERGVTALMCACSCTASNSVDCVAALLESGSKIDTQDVAGLTALHHAVMADNAGTVEFLMKAGADVSIVDRTGRAAVDYAIEMQSYREANEPEQDQGANTEIQPGQRQQRSIVNTLLYSDKLTLQMLS